MSHRAFRLLCYDFHRGRMSEFLVERKRGPKRKHTKGKIGANIIDLSRYQHPVSKLKQPKRLSRGIAAPAVAAKGLRRPSPHRRDEEHRRVGVGATSQVLSDIACGGLAFTTGIGAFVLLVPDRRSSPVMALPPDQDPATVWFLDAVLDTGLVPQDLSRIGTRSSPTAHAIPDRAAIAGDLPRDMPGLGGPLSAEPHLLSGSSLPCRGGPQIGDRPASPWRMVSLEGSRLRHLCISDLGQATPAILTTASPTSIAGTLVLGHPVPMRAGRHGARPPRVDARPAPAGLRVDFDAGFPGATSGLFRIIACRVGV